MYFKFLKFTHESNVESKNLDLLLVNGFTNIFNRVANEKNLYSIASSRKNITVYILIDIYE